MITFIDVVKKIDLALARFETWLIVVVVCAMLLMTSLHVLLKLIGMPVVQLEEGARFLVIWVAFAGGAVAAHQGRHINVDVFSRFLRGRWGRVIMTIVWTIGTAMTALLLDKAVSYVFISENSLLHDSDVAINFNIGGRTFGLPGWVAASIIPLGLLLITVHMIFAAIYAGAGHVGPGQFKAPDAARTVEDQRGEA